MADELNADTALELAKSLKTIDGFPWEVESIRATAEDLVRWCKGAFLGNCRWPAEAQADWLVTEVRETWDKWRGTRALRRLFEAKFSPPTREEPWSEEKSQREEARMLAAAFSRGHLAPPCEHCEPGDPYCEHGGPRRHAYEKARALELARHAPPPAAPVTELSLDQLRAKARALYEDEMRRKREQLGRLGVD